MIFNRKRNRNPNRENNRSGSEDDKAYIDNYYLAKEEGRKEAHHSVIINMSTLGYDIKEIKKIVACTEEEIEEVINGDKNLMQREEIMERLREAGIQVEIGEKKPQNGQYSGIVGTRKGKRIIDINMNSRL